MGASDGTTVSYLGIHAVYLAFLSLSHIEKWVGVN